MPISSSMTFFDLLIIYLACGSPFGVYYFLHYRKRSFSRQVWIKTILTFLFWIPFAYRLLKNGKIKRKLFNLKFDAGKSLESEQEKILFSIRQQIEKVFLEAGLSISVYEIREVIERYEGLTIAYKNPNKSINETAAELFRIAGRENIKLGALCLERRNQKRLAFHQTRAREDFCNLLRDAAAKTSDQSGRLENISLELAKFLDDQSGIFEIEKLFKTNLQSNEEMSVKDLESDLWKAEKHKPQPAQQISINLQSLRARTNSFSKD